MTNLSKSASPSEPRQDVMDEAVRQIVAISMAGLNQPLWETRNKVEAEIRKLLNSAESAQDLIICENCEKEPATSETDDMVWLCDTCWTECFREGDKYKHALEVIAASSSDGKAVDVAVKALHDYPSDGETTRKLKSGPYKPWCAEHQQAPPCTECDYETPAEPRRDEREAAIEHGRYLADAAQACLDERNRYDMAVAGYADESSEVADMDSLADHHQALRTAIYEFRKRAARASAAPLLGTCDYGPHPGVGETPHKKTPECVNWEYTAEPLLNQTLPMSEEFAIKWMQICRPHNIGPSVATPESLTEKIRASLPQPSAGQEWLLKKLKKGERDFIDLANNQFAGGQVSLYFTQLLELYKKEFGEPSAASEGE